MGEIIGVLFFVFIFLLAFWVLIFLGMFIGGWITICTIEKINPKLAERLVGHNEDD